LRSDIYEKEYSVVTLISPIGAFCSGRVGHASGRGLPVSGARLRAVPDVFLAKIPPYAGHRDRRADLVLAKPPSGRAWRAGRTGDRRHRRFPRRGRAKMVGWPQFLYRCRSRVERAVGAGSFGDRYLRKTCHVRRDFLGLCRPVHARLECGSFGSALRTLDPGPAAPIAQRYPPQPIPQTAGHSTIFRGFSAEFTRKSSAFSRPLHNAISTRNEGSAGLGGRICPVVKSLQNLSNDHVYQYIETMNAHVGGQAGAVRCCHRAKCFGLAAGLCRDLFP
jgi:hypothetical protein